MNTKHTPGPWTLEDRGYKFVVSKPGKGYITRDVCRMDASTMSAFDQDANARLIAAAPDLLEALRHIANHDLRGADLVICGHIAHGLVGRARDAIKAAEDAPDR